MSLNDNFLRRLKDEFILDWNGIHGYFHWMRVLDNGLKIAESTGANIKIVELFSVLHDSKRKNDGFDPLHGKRAARYVDELKGEFIFLCEEEEEMLKLALKNHSEGLLQAPLTVQTCWDADRLDLWRVGIEPLPEYLCTEAAKELLKFKRF